MSSQPRASERSERHPGLSEAFQTRPEGAKAATETFLPLLLPLRGDSFVLLANPGCRSLRSLALGWELIAPSGRALYACQLVGARLEDWGVWIVGKRNTISPPCGGKIRAAGCFGYAVAACRGRGSSGGRRFMPCPVRASASSYTGRKLPSGQSTGWGRGKRSAC